MGIIKCFFFKKIIGIYQYKKRILRDTYILQYFRNLIGTLHLFLSFFFVSSNTYYIFFSIIHLSKFILLYEVFDRKTFPYKIRDQNLNEMKLYTQIV